MTPTPGQTPASTGGTAWACAPGEAKPGGLHTADPLPSEALLQGRGIIHIQHNGAVYRLQATRQGKLILTK